MTRIGSNIPRPWCSPCPVWTRFRAPGYPWTRCDWMIKQPPASLQPAKVATESEPD